MSALGVIAAIVVILASIMLHEGGHFLTAKYFGMKATRFFLGFGPTLWSTHRGETEYGIKAIPAGGFVKIVGMTPLEEIEPGDENRVFYRQPARQRLVVLSAGSAVHLLIALILTYLVVVFAGDLTSPQAQVYVSDAPACIIVDPNQKACLPTDPRSPSHGVLQHGDLLLFVNGTPIRTDNTLRNALHIGVPVHLVVRRDHVRVPVTVTPVAVAETVKGKTTTSAKIGVILSDKPNPPSVGALSAVPKTFSTMGEFFTESVKGLARIPHTLGDVLSGKQRNVNDVGTVIAATRYSGEIAGATQAPAGVRIGEFLLLMAGLNFFIGVFNMLPLLPLDGGHVGILLYEEARSRIYRLLGRLDPGRVDLNKVMPFTYAVFVAIVAMSAILLYADIFRPIKLNG